MEPTNTTPEPNETAPEPSQQPQNVTGPTIISPTTSQNVPEATPEPSVISTGPTPIAAPMGNPAPEPVVNPSIAGVTPVKRAKRKKVMFAAALLAVLLLAGGGLVFGLYLPSRPENVFTRGLSRTGTALDDVVNTASQPDMQSKYKNVNMTGKVDFSADTFGSVNATIDGASSATAGKLDVTATLKQNGGAAQTFSGKLLASLPTGKKYPNTYFQISGLKALGVDAFLPGVSQYDGKWLELSSSYLESLSGALGASSSVKQTDISVADTTAFAKSMSSLSKQYIFTSDTKKGILENQAYLGKEDIQGVKASRFRVGFNQAHFKAFCTPFTDTVFSSALIKKYVTDARTLSQQKAEALKSCQATKFKSSDTFDVWIGGKYDLVRQIRVYDEKNAKTYADVGQKYSGGDVIPFYFDFHSESAPKADVNGTMTLNTKTGDVTTDVTGKGTDPGAGFKLDAHFSVTPSKTTPNISEPTDALDIGQLIQQLQSQYAPSATSSDTINI